MRVRAQMMLVGCLLIWAFSSSEGQANRCKAIGGVSQSQVIPIIPAIDSLHPRNFVTISEISKRGQIRTVYDAKVAAKMNIEVDRDSKLFIHIDQAFLECAKFEGYFGISGAVFTSGDPRPIEIPGYSVIGKASESVPVSVGAVSAMNAIMKELEKESIELERAIGGARAAADDEARTRSAVFNGLPAKQLRVASSQTALRARRLQTESVTAQLTAARLHMDSLRIARADTSQAIVNLTNIANQYAALRTTLAAEEATVSADEQSLKADSLILQRESNREFVKKLQNALNAGSHARFALRAMSNPQNAHLVRLFSQSVDRMPEVLVGLAGTTDSLWSAIAKVDIASSEDSLARVVSSSDNFRSGLRDLAGLGSAADSVSRHAFVRLAVGAVKDAEILVRQTGAQPGDRISLTFSDSLIGQSSSTRTMVVQILIRDFGFVQKISDAVVLMKLPGFPESAALAAAQAEANSSGQAKSLNFPVRMRGNPVAGVTLGWTYVPRVEDDYAVIPRPVRVLASWLRPGFGFNAGVPSVPQKTVTLTPNKTPTETSKDAEVAYTAGVILTAFDNLVSFSTGRTLTGPKGRTYTAWGISFLSATDKARELFKNLER